MVLLFPGIYGFVKGVFTADSSSSALAGRCSIRQGQCGVRATLVGRFDVKWDLDLGVKGGWHRRLLFYYTPGTNW
jgi:hypothetical protein